jgi:hypothetical protein
MATQTNAIVTARAAGTISRPNEYMGVVRAIPVSFSGDFADGDVLVFSEVMEQNAKVIQIDIANTDLGTGVTIDIGYTGTADGIIDGADVASAGIVRYVGTPVDVSGKAIVGTVKGAWDAGTLKGNILVVTDW